MMPGEYKFGTDEKEIIQIIAGNLDVFIADSDALYEGLLMEIIDNKMKSNLTLQYKRRKLWNSVHFQSA
jgi:uncharacterized protein YaiE (UPF0345 family)